MVPVTNGGWSHRMMINLPSYAEQTISGLPTFALGYAGKSVTDPRSELGFRTDNSFAVQDGLLTLRTRFAWAHDYAPNRTMAATFQTLPASSFVVNGAAGDGLGADDSLGRDEVAQRLVGGSDLRGRVLECDQQLRRQGRRALRLVMSASGLLRR